MQDYLPQIQEANYTTIHYDPTVDVKMKQDHILKHWVLSETEK